MHFPWKLHKLLETVEDEGTDSVVSWEPHGKTFRVHNKFKFAVRIMPKYFNSTKYKTFQRSLNLWGFEIITQGPNKGSIFNPNFVRNKPELCEKMTRIKIKGKSHVPSLKPSNFSSKDSNSQSQCAFSGAVKTPQLPSQQRNGLLSRLDSANSTVVDLAFTPLARAGAELSDAMGWRAACLRQMEETGRGSSEKLLNRAFVDALTVNQLHFEIPNYFDAASIARMLASAKPHRQSTVPLPQQGLEIATILSLLGRTMALDTAAISQQWFLDSLSPHFRGYLLNKCFVSTQAVEATSWKG